MNPFLPASLSTQSLHPQKNQNSPYLKLLIPPNSQFDARRVAYLTPTKPTFNIGTVAQSDSTRRDFQKRSSDIKLPFIIDSKQRTRTIQSPPSNGKKTSQFFTYSDSPVLPRKTSPDRPVDIPFGLATLDKKVFVPEGLLPGFNGSDHYYDLGSIAGSKSSKRLPTNPNRDSLDVFVNGDGLGSPKKTGNDSDDNKDDKQTTKRSHKKKSKSPKEKKRRSKRAATLDESQHHVRVDKNMLETVIQTALLGTRLNEQRLEKLEREIQKYGPHPHDERLRSPLNPRKFEYDSFANEVRANPNLLLHNRERELFTPQQQPPASGLAEFFDRNRPRYETTFKPSSRLEARLRGFKVNSYETSVNAEARSHGKHLTFADEYPNYSRNYDPRDRLGVPIKTEAIDEESRNELYSPYQQDMYYNRRQYNQINDRSYDAQNDDYYHKNSYHEESKGSKRPLNSLLQDYFARGRDREFPPITDQPTHNSHFNGDDGNHPQSLEIGKTIHDSFLKEKEEDEEEKNAQIKKSVLKQNRRFGVDEAEIARRRKELRIVLWGMTYTRLLSNAVRDYFRKKNKIFQDWFPRTSFNNAGMFQAFLAKHLPTPFMNILKEKKNLQIAGSQGTVKELDQKCKLISEHINNIFTQLLKNLKKEWLPSSFFVFLGSFVQDRSHLPHDYYTNFEIDRLHISRYSALENMKPENIKMLIGAYAIVRVMLCRVMTKPWLTWNQTKHDDFDLMNSFNIASIIYQAFMDVFFNQNPIIPDNQQHLLKQEKVPSVRVRTKAMESGKYPGTDEDEYEGIIQGFYNKEALRAFIKDRPALYAKVIAWANTILDCLFEITKKHFNASSVDTKKYYTKLLPN